MNIEEFNHFFILNKQTQLDTDQTLVTKYHNLLHLRHDLIHFAVNHVLCQPQQFGTVRKLSELFSAFLPEEMSKYAPDVFDIFSGRAFFLDVSCSYNYEYNRSEKLQKYQPILDFLSGQGMPSFPFYYFWVHPNWSNFDSEIAKLIDFCDHSNIPTTYFPKNLNIHLKLFYEELSLEIDSMKYKIPENLDNFEVDSPPKPDLLSEEFLDSFCSDKYEHWECINSKLNMATDQEVDDTFESLVKDEQVRKVLADSKHSDEMYKKSFTYLRDVESVYPKGHTHPSFYIPYATPNISCKKVLDSVPLDSKNLESKLKLEQRYCLKMLQCYVNNSEDKDSHSFLSKLLDSTLDCLKYEIDLNIFNTGLITNSDKDEIVLNEKYKEFRSSSKRGDSSISKRRFFSNITSKVDMKEKLPYIYRNKCIKLPGEMLKSHFVSSSGTSYRKTHEVREYKEKTTIGSQEFEHFESFMDLLETDLESRATVHKFLGNHAGVDSKYANLIKSMIFNRHNDFLKQVSSKNVYNFAKHVSLTASQLLHFNEMRTTDNTIYMMNSGLHNVLHIVRGGSQCRGRDVGQAFFTIFLTDNIKWANKVYGDIKITKFFKFNKPYYLCRTPWVRLSSEKLNFMKDQFYATLSTAYDTWCRVEEEMFLKDYLRHMYTFRTCVSFAPSQKIAELLMDTRYIFMSALSKYSNVEELIKEKFLPPYKNCFEQFIVRQLERKCYQVIEFLKCNPPKPLKPTYLGKKRTTDSLGGTLRIPSLWSNAILPNLQCIFDDIFVYVHTSKEASSEYHEQVKAINTILKYQSIYDSLSSTMQSGTASLGELKQWLLSKCQVGCWTPAIFIGSKRFSRNYKGLYKTQEFRENCLTEPLSNLVSTKACIPEYDRHVKEVEFNRKEMNRVIESLNLLAKDIPKLNFNKTFYKIDVDFDAVEEISIGSSLRVKVHDALLDWTTRFGSNKNYILDLASWNIKENSGRVLADTCIKAQYGSKREFYVVNLGAKSMARVTENAYKVLSKYCRNEMISVPGDKKFEFIQESIDNTLLAAERVQDQVLYVNGDCTKWSACETMASFIAMSAGLKEVFGSEVYSYIQSTFCAWSSKQIQVPQSILEKIRYNSDKTKYIDETTCIKSTQNFLQGMFNYSSSIKAVIATEFAIYQFNRLNPGKRIHVNHLEHSDDYSLVVRVTNLEHFEEFRIYHKLSQKLFGINDSIKKTNIQFHILEFISLFSFNGQLYYPNIKKLKEVGTNLSCTDFRSDAMSILSRVSEAVRLGITLESAYFMQRLHCCSVADAYSLSPGMKNDNCDIVTRFSMPLELFGLPDTLPIISLLAKGNTENFRLFHYGSDTLKKQLLVLYELGQLCYTSLDLPSEHFEEDLSEMYNPGFSYPVRHNKLKAIKSRLNIDYTEARTYFQENLTDTLVKPVETSRFSTWLRAMYFNKTFCNAYMKASRASMTLRHSLFSSKACLTVLTEDLSEVVEKRHFQTIKSYISNMLLYCETHVLKNKTLPNKAFLDYVDCYSLGIKVFYDTINGSVLNSGKYEPNKTIVSKMPSAYRWLNFENKPAILLQYLVNKDNFLKDRRKFISETSLYRDILKLEQYFNIDLIKRMPSYARQVFKEIKSQEPSQSYGLVFGSKCETPKEFIKQYMERGLFEKQKFIFKPEKRMVLTHGLSDFPKFFYDMDTSLDNYTAFLHQLCLIYRAIYLRNKPELTNFCNEILNVIPNNLNVTVSDFFQKIDLGILDSLKIGTFARKIFCYMKYQLLGDPTDLHTFLRSHFFYTVNYLHAKDIPDGFSESASIVFLDVCFRAHRYKSEFDDFVILEIPQTNRTFWFYCLSIAERVFGMISQSELDFRLVESKDFKIKKVRQELRYLFTSIVHQMNHTLYSLNGKIIKPEINVDKADLPIVTQSVLYYKRSGQSTHFFSLVNINLDDMSVVSGKMILYKLPFGNLRETDCISSDFLNNYKLDNVPLGILCEKKALMSYLKNEIFVNFSEQEIESLAFDVWGGFDKEVRSTYKFSDVLHNYCPKTETTFPQKFDINPPKTKKLNQVALDLFNKAQQDDFEVFQTLMQGHIENKFLTTKQIDQTDLNTGLDVNESIVGDTEIEESKKTSNSIPDIKKPLIKPIINIQLDSDSDDGFDASMFSDSLPSHFLDETIEDKALLKKEEQAGDINVSILASSKQAEPNNEHILFKNEMKKEELLGFKLTDNVVIEVDSDEDDFVPFSNNITILNNKEYVIGKDQEQRQKVIQTYSEIADKVKLGYYSGYMNVEETRDWIELADIDEEELGELLDIEDMEVRKETLSSSSDSNDSVESELNAGITQMLQSGDLVSAKYGYEQRSRKIMLPLNEFIVNCWLGTSIDYLLTHPTALSNFLILINSLAKFRSQVSLKPYQKAVLKITLKSLTERIRSCNQHVRLSKNRALYYQRGKIYMKAIFLFENRDKMLSIVNRKQQALVLTGTPGFTDYEYMSLDMKQGDVDRFYEQKPTDSKLSISSPFMNLVEGLFPKFEVIDNELDDKYFD